MKKKLLEAPDGFDEALIIPHPKNPRVISKRQDQKLGDYMEQLGEIGGITINKLTNRKITGNQRGRKIDLKTAKIEWYVVNDEPDQVGTIASGVVYLEVENKPPIPFNLRYVEWDEETENLALIVANKAGGTWDWGILKEFGTDWLKGIGFEEKELQQKGVSAKNAKQDKFDPKPPSKTDKKVGDIFELHSLGYGLVHRLMCGSCTDKENVTKVLDGAIIDLIITDPPYGVAYVGKTKDALTIENDAMSEEDTEKLWQDCIEAFFPHWKKGGVIYATVPAGNLNIIFAKALHAIKALRQQLLWNKDSMVMGRSDYHYKHEPILYGWKPGAAHYWGGTRNKTSVLDFARPKRSTEHPTMKPLELWGELMDNGSREKEIVYDPFTGSGTSLITAEQLGRQYRGLELSPHYADVIVNRWIAYMKDEAREYKIFKNGKEL